MRSRREGRDHTDDGYRHFGVTSPGASMHLRRLRHALPLLAVLGLTGMSFPATEGMQVSTAASKCGVTSSALLAWNPGSVGHTYNGTPYLISGATVTCPGDPGVGWSVHRPYSPPAPTPAQLARAIDRSEVVISQNPQEPGFLFMHTAPGVRGGGSSSARSRSPEARLPPTCSKATRAQDTRRSRSA